MTCHLRVIPLVVGYAGALLSIWASAQGSGFRQVALRLRPDREYSAIAEAEMMGSPLALYAVSLKNKVISDQYRDRQKEP
jgi:hypothetical protein